jgi:hypothetical protein
MLVQVSTLATVYELYLNLTTIFAGVLTYQCQEFSVLEDDADADDDPIIDAGTCKKRVVIRCFRYHT